MEPNEIQRQDRGESQADEPTELSEREREILVLVAEGASNKEVALKLVISPNTVKVHLRNIFGKIGVSSRTEAALYAVRAGLVPVAVEQPAAEADPVHGAEPPEFEAPALPEAPSAVSALVADEPAPSAPLPVLAPQPRQLPPRLWLAGAALLAVVALAAVVVLPRVWPGLGGTPTAIAFTNPPRWEARAPMPTARRQLAAVTYNNEVYAIGGETAAGVSGLNERYSPTENAWTTLAEKPVPVADVNAAVIGGLIYVPGGRLASGIPTTALEVYDPDADEWSTRAPLPVALSGYALTSFEGRLYVFGGWNGADFVASVYEYDPAADDWIERTRMPTARGFAAAVPSGGKIYVIGGTEAKGAARAYEAYVPARDSEVANPWESLPPPPAGYTVLGAAAIADTLYVAGQDTAAGRFAAWSVRPADNAWTALESVPTEFAPDWLSVAAVQTHIYVLGAPEAEGEAGHLMAYQALYTSLIPVITSGE